jgi:anti-anti-sigma factor
LVRALTERGAVVPPKALEDVTVEQTAPNTAIAVFSGEHDLATKNEIRELLISLVEENELIVADFSRAEFVDSSILDVLRDVDKDAQDRGRTFRLQLNTAAIVRRAFEICGFYESMVIAATREAALEVER